jgi:predicted GIY-YIG superfamily endonuclease
MTVYVLEFERPLGDLDNPHGSARYYVGFCDSDRELNDRLAEHRSGWGAAITRAANQKGIGYRVVALLRGGTRDDERRLKRRKEMPRLIAKLRRQQPNAEVLDLTSILRG